MPEDGVIPGPSLTIYVVYKKDGEVVNPGDQYPNEFRVSVGAPERNKMEFDEWVKACVEGVLMSNGIAECPYEISWDTVNPYPPRG